MTTRLLSIFSDNSRAVGRTILPLIYLYNQDRFFLLREGRQNQWLVLEELINLSENFRDREVELHQRFQEYSTQYPNETLCIRRISVKISMEEFSLV